MQLKSTACESAAKRITNLDSHELTLAIGGNGRLSIPLGSLTNASFGDDISIY